MTITLSRNTVIAIVTAAFVMIGALVWLALPESCDHWKDRHMQALANSMSFYGLDRSDERRALAIVESQRPVGCR